MTPDLITRDVILDLLPLYLAGEASDDTRQLVEAYLQTDPKLAVLAQQAAVPPPHTGQDPLEHLLGDLDHSLETPFTKETSAMDKFEYTKRLIFQHSLFLALAIFTSLLFIAFGFNEDGVYWLWADTPEIGWPIFLVSALFWTAFLNVSYQLRVKG